MTDYNTDRFAWLVSYCDPDGSHSEYRQQCERPAFDDSLDNIDNFRPVTDTLSRTSYRNIFCADCNGVDRVSLIKWTIQVGSTNNISITVDNDMKKLRQRRGNLIFLKPRYIFVDKCSLIPPYHITSCNETGLWTFFDEHIDRACNSFVDPFNSTYKNYFCYLCNKPDSESINENDSCVIETFNIITPRFFSMLDLSRVEGKRNDIQIQCGTSQFLDRVLVSCKGPENLICNRPNG